ncbi:MAG: DAK2 domain-containing protein [Oscillospiraceae bacterium]|nr:DAK2 domain-containing protein [Oscillospiraceae bacterium]
MITGSMFRDALISGANNITAQKQQIDELNVFPVPDGDTGTNMSMTIGAAARELKRLSDDCTVAEAASCAASALLRGARGNSGVILSLIFRGISKGLADCKTATADDLARGLVLGTESAYKAVMKPTEGTILTVIRLTAKKATAFVETNKEIVPFWETVCKASKDALAKTPEILPVLKKAGVVDAGGKGLTVIFDGMMSVFRDGVMISEATEGAESAPAAQSKESNIADFEEEINFTYCTEFIVQRAKDNDRDPLALRAYLESIGDCVVVVDDESIIKVHVHTDNPGKALQQGLKYGMLTNMKIENMREQFENRVSAAEQSTPAAPEYVKVDPDVPYGFVSVCAGEGVAQLFTDLGVDKIVSGGQTMNPSTDDILAAVQSVPAKTVFVLPNNKNIIMAAEQAVPLADREIRVLHTRTIPQGLSAMLTFDCDASADDNQKEMMKAAENVGSGQITFAARDSDYEGYKIKEGELLALENGKLSFVEKDLQKAAVKLTRSLIKKDSSFVTILYGEGVSDEEAEAMVSALKEKISEEIDVSLVKGDQPVYYYIISVE